MNGFHTTAVAAVWLCYHTLRDPEIRARIHAAADQDGDPSSTAYLEAACKESLRLNPPFRGEFRRVPAPTMMDGIALQAGTMVMPLVSLTHQIGRAHV